jgi:hypothetical protein
MWVATDSEMVVDNLCSLNFANNETAFSTAQHTPRMAQQKQPLPPHVKDAILHVVWDLIENPPPSGKVTLNGLHAPVCLSVCLWSPCACRQQHHATDAATRVDLDWISQGSLRASLMSNLWSCSDFCLLHA